MGPENCLWLGCQPIDLGLYGGKGTSSSRKKWRVLTFGNYVLTPGRKSDFNSVWIWACVLEVYAGTEPSVVWISRIPQGIYLMVQIVLVWLSLSRDPQTDPQTFSGNSTAAGYFLCAHGITRVSLVGGVSKWAVHGFGWQVKFDHRSQIYSLCCKASIWRILAGLQPNSSQGCYLTTEEKAGWGLASKQTFLVWPVWTYQQNNSIPSALFPNQLQMTSLEMGAGKQSIPILSKE